MMHAWIRRGRATLTVLGASVLLAVTGCAGSTSPIASGTSTAEAGAPVVIAYPVPDLGPSPAPAPLDAAATEALRLEQQDGDWQSLTTTYPDAVRPPDPFREYDDIAASPKRIDCFEAAGIPVDIGTDADGGGPAGIMVSPASEAQSVASFTCWNAYPSPPIAPLTSEQIDYLYSYLTEYLVPCFEANGVTNAPAPTRADFVSQWPRQNWFPSTGDALLPPEQDEAINEACVHPE